MKLSFLGDISLNDDYIQLKKANAKPFDNIISYLKDSNFVIGNLECLSIGNNGENELKKPRLKTTIDTLNYLNDIQLDLALLAHNHVYDNLYDGFTKTIDFLEENKIKYIGAGTSREDAAKPFIELVEDKKICILNYVSKDTNPNIPDDADIYVNWYDIQNVITDIKTYRTDVDYIIVCLHWGGRYEGGLYPDWALIEQSYLIIDAGADLIIGGHSHTLQPMQKYKNKSIYYSLGNFCFSDIVFEGEKFPNDNPNRQESLIVEVCLKDKYYDINHIPIKFPNLMHQEDQDVLRRWKIRNRIFKLMSKFPFIWKIYSKYFNYAKPLLRYISRKDRNIIEKIKHINPDKIKRFIGK